MSRVYGKKLEREIHAAVKLLKATSSSQGEMLPVDRVACLPGGRYLAIECKECRKDRFEFRRISPRERQHLSRTQACGGLSLLVIQRIYSNYSRTWCIHWLDLVRLWPDLAGSIPLADSRRPEALAEVLQIERDGLGKALDLHPIIHLHPIIQEVS